MIVTRSPLRISLGGGGTDIPFYFKKYGSFFISCAINKHVYICLNEINEKKYFLRYSKNETVENVNDIRHNLFREVLKFYNVKPGVEITSFADLPSGTGLGSSGAFLCSLILALDIYTGNKRSNVEIAKLASKIEIDNLKETVGYQDTLISAIGGLTAFSIDKKTNIEYKKNFITSEKIKKLENSLLLIDTNTKRSSSKELEKTMSKAKNKEILIENLHQIKQLGYDSHKLLKDQNNRLLGQVLTEQWKKKFERSKSKYHIYVDGLISEINLLGAYGAKLIGAGGGGYILTFIPKSKISDLKTLVESYNLNIIDLQITNKGVSKFDL